MTIDRPPASARVPGIARLPSSAAPLRLRTDCLDSPLGPLSIVCTDTALCAVEFDDAEDRMQAVLRRRFGAYDLIAERDPLGVTSRLARYFAGDVRAPDEIVVAGGGTPYQERVWTALRTIPAGQTCGYGQFARQLGGTHARAVGQANSLNPIAIVVPCHRVIGANAALTGYAGGLERKRWLLDHEARAAGRSPTFTGLDRYHHTR